MGIIHLTWPFTASGATLALKTGLRSLRTLDISHPFSTPTAALSLGAGLSLATCPIFLVHLTTSGNPGDVLGLHFQELKPTLA